MRHNHKGRKLGRTASHRAATLDALTTSLLKHKKIRTTVAKAKEMRLHVEPIITTAKRAYLLQDGDEKTLAAKRVHARRMVARHVKDNDVLKTLFTEIAPKVADRPGGYTRVVKLGRRLGDAAEMALIELVDWNDVSAPKTKISKPRPTRRKNQPAKVENVAPAIVGSTVADALPEPAEAVGEEAPEKE